MEIYYDGCPYWLFNKFGQFQKGFGDAILDTPEILLNVAEEAILTVGDVGVASYKGAVGESNTFNAQSAIGQTYQEKGVVSGSLDLIGSLVTGSVSPIKDFHDGNYEGLGQALGGVTVGLGALKLKQGYDKTLDSLSSGFNIDADSLYQGTNNQIGLIPDVIPSNESIRFSQSSVSSRTGEGQFLLDLTDNIATNGFNPDYPLTTIRLPDDGLTSFDNRRLLSSDAAGVTPFVSIFDFDSPIPQDRFNNFNDRDKIFPSSFSDIASQRTFQKDSPISTWGEASILRGINQVAPKGREGIGFDVYGSKDLPVITPTRLEGGAFDTEGARYLESLKSSGVFNGDKVSSSTPSEYARSLQGSGNYPGKDVYRDITLSKGTVIYGGTPGQSEFYTTKSALERSGFSSERLFDGLQVAPGDPSRIPTHSITGLNRPGVTAYEVINDIPAAFGRTLANPGQGSGGLPQIVIENYQDFLKPIYSIPLKK